ncbi:MAG: NapC/NirT family cytochrome c [Chloroflexota bacterium]
MSLKESVRNFFFPPAGSPRWRVILPFAALAVIILIVLAGATYGWDYTNSPQFCGTTCHTMPPQNAVYLDSPHANVYCTECHIGRAFVGEQFARKSEDLREIYAMVFHTYEFPIRATRSRPALETCEKCHLPETFSDDSLRVITHFGDNIDNPPTNIYLVMKTGGGSRREGLGRGIHWHIENPVFYYAADDLNQVIPYVRVVNEDGSFVEYVDVESNFDAASVDESRLKPMDCITCHNRVTHDFAPPAVSVDDAMARGLIDPDIPGIHVRAVEVLSASYASRAEAMQAIDDLETYYTSTDYYPGHGEQVSLAVQTLKDIYDRTVFHDQKVDWTTHPSNLGHIDAPGCFRCHDGKHLSADNEAIRLECNLCHSIPIVADEDSFVARIEISRGPEPESHLNPNWISLHNQVFDSTCANCHEAGDPGGTSNTSFCSNSACHGSVYTYAGFDAPKLREILQSQIPAPAPTESLPAVPENLTFDNFIGALFASKCTVCHGENPSAGLGFLTYADALKGGANGPVILPGDSANSLIIQVQSGDHFANFSAEDLELLRQWIDAGAPEH